METVTPNESLAEVVKKIDAAAYDVRILEMIYICKKLRKTIGVLSKNNETVLELKEENRSQEFIEGYFYTCDFWVDNMSEEIKDIQITVLERMGIGWLYRHYSKPFKEAFSDYGNDIIDIDGLFSAFKKSARELYVRV